MVRRSAAGGRARPLGWDELVELALAKPGAWADHPWGEGDLVVKVGSRIFAFCGSGDPQPPATHSAVTLRARPEDVPVWREQYPEAVGPAPYMRTKPWNRVVLDGTVPDDDLRAMLDDSYDCVVERLTRKERPPGWAPRR